MESTYRMVSSYGWAFYLIGAAYFGWMVYFMRSSRNRQIFLKFSKADSDIAAIATHCRKQTGYISAVLTRYTALITINVLIFNFVYNVTRYTPQLNGMMGEISRPVIVLYAVCVACIVAILVLIYSIFVICSEVIRQTEVSQ
ncbi:hypothetical protein [Sphingomonas sp.]|uniref:hypothetical protein n=1 Tax=Sphingomonas sp. TaxID=28214 RepID=UPI00286D4937|nr:hypothetical protein [Sphingomonas sp.]